jgi:hypothetical protein
MPGTVSGTLYYLITSLQQAMMHSIKYQFVILWPYDDNAEDFEGRETQKCSASDKDNWPHCSFQLLHTIFSKNCVVSIFSFWHRESKFHIHSKMNFTLEVFQHFISSVPPWWVHKGSNRLSLSISLCLAQYFVNIYWPALCFVWFQSFS